MVRARNPARVGGQTAQAALGLLEDLREDRQKSSLEIELMPVRGGRE